MLWFLKIRTPLVINNILEENHVFILFSFLFLKWCKLEMICWAYSDLYGFFGSLASLIIALCLEPPFNFYLFKQQWENIKKSPSLVKFLSIDWLMIFGIFTRLTALDREKNESDSQINVKSREQLKSFSLSRISPWKDPNKRKEGNIYLSCPAPPCKRCHVIVHLMRMRALIFWISTTSEKLRNKLLSNFNTQTSRLG